MKIDFTDEMLREAVVRADIRELEAMPADHEIEHEFSKRFERRMGKLIRRGKTGSPAGGAVFLRRRAVALAAAIVILLASAMSVSAVRAAVFEFITEAYEKFTHIFFEESPPSQESADELSIRRPSFIPEGFELVSEKMAGPVLLVYEKGSDYISYSQQRLEDVSMDINTEGAALEELEFKGLPANTTPTGAFKTCYGTTTNTYIWYPRRWTGTPCSGSPEALKRRARTQARRESKIFLKNSFFPVTKTPFDLFL